MSDSFINRRKFVGMAGLAAGTTLLPGFTFAEPAIIDRKIRMGIIGGNFGAGFQFHEHPNCTVEAVSDLRPERRDKLMQVYKCAKSYESLEKLILDPKIEAVFIATPAPDHTRHVLASLQAGKHVLCAVPVATTLEDCAKILAAVKRTGLTYMMAETSVWYQNTISVRKLYQEGAFGKIFSAAAEYNHPGLETLYMENGRPTWRYGMTPMLYPTHCTSFLISVTGERLTQVSGIGYGDNSPILKNNPWKNPFWNETAFFNTNKGTAFRAEVNWRGALRDTVRAEWRGEKMSFISGPQESKDHVVVRYGSEIGRDDAGFKFIKPKVEDYDQPQWWKTDLLPEPMRHDSGHYGSHTFITHEFIDALINARKPQVDIYEAIAYTAPGIVAHKSAMKGGESMKIPNFDEK